MFVFDMRRSAIETAGVLRVHFKKECYFLKKIIK